MPGMTDAEFLGSGAPPPGGGMSDAEFMGATPGSPSAAPTMASSAQQWAKDISTVRPDQSASMFGTPVTQRQDTYGQQVKAYWDEGVRKAKEGLGRVMEATDPLKPHMGPFGTVGGLGEAASGAVSALASPVTAVTNPAWEYATGIPGEKAINALGAGTPVRGAGALNLRPRAPVPEINPAIPPRGSALALPGTLQRPPVVDMDALEASLAGPAAERAPTASAAPSEASGTRLLPPEAPHESYSGRASVGAAGNENPLADYSPQTIAKLRGDLQQAFPTPHLLEQAIEERSAHHTLGELSPDLEAKMGGLAASSGPERAEIVSALAQRAREGKDRMRAVLDRGFGPAQNRFELAKRLKTQQAEESKPFWDAFKRTVITPTPELEALMPRLKAAGALQAANKALRIEGLPETHWFEGRELGTEVRVPTATAFQYAKEHLDDLIERAMAAPGGANETRRLAQLKTDLVNAIDRHPDPNTAGVWKAAREAYAPASQIEKAMRLGERVLTGHVHEDELPFLTASFGPNETAAMKIGMRNYLEDRFGKPGKVERGTINTILAPSNQKKIAWAIGDEAADRIVDAIEHEQSMLDAPSRIHGNSQTMARSEARKEWVPGAGPLDKLGGVSLGDIAGAAVHPVKTAGKMVAKAGFNKFAAKKEAEFAKLREEAARIYTLQGVERDAVARALLGSEEGPIGPAAVSSGPRPWEPPARFTAPPVARNPQKTAAYARYEAPPKEEKIAPAKVDLSRGKKLEKDTSLFQFLAHHGGLKETPDLRSILDGNPLVPGYGRLLRKNGLTEDHAREIAVEAGFLPETGGSGVNTSSIGDLHEAIRDEAHGKRRYRLGVAPEAKVDAAENQRLRDEHIDAAFHDDGIPPPTGALRDRVAELVFREGVEDPLEAYERAVMEEHYAGRNEATTLPGIPKGIPGWELPDEPGPASPGGHGASPARRPKGEAAGAASRHAGERNRAPAAGTGAKAVKPPPFASGGAVRPPLSTRKQSNYSPTAGTKSRHCGPCKAWPNGSCSMYREHNKCTAVVGFIAAKGACDWWEKGVPHRADGGALSDDDIAAQDAAEAAAARVRAPYAKANARASGLPDVVNYFGNKLASAVTAPRDALYGTMQVTDPETGMPTREAMERGQSVANMAMTGAVPFAQRGAAGMAGGRLTQPTLKVADDGIRINIAPHDMQVPEWGKGLSWGLTAYRSKVNGEDAIHVRDARLPPEMRGQGHGTAMYEHAADLAAKEGKPLLSDGTVTQDAANRWMALNRAGYNVQMAPDKVFRPGPPEAPHLGRFETPDGSPVFRVEPAAAPGITAYHGSPHDFDRFDLSKIGTGEGAQAYGHGLYFAENEGVARGYRERLSDRAEAPPSILVGPDKRQIDVYDVPGEVSTLRGMRNDVSHEQLKKEARENLTRAQSIKGQMREPATKRAQAAVDWLNQNEGAHWTTNPEIGRMYQVAIKAPPEHFLDWDKPLSEQSPEAKIAVQRLASEIGAKDYRTSGQGLIESLGSALMRKEGLSPNDARAAVSTRLREAGIPGIKYLDQGSRAQPTPTYPQGYKITPPAQNIHGKWMVKSSDYNSKGMLFDTQAQAQAKLDEMFPGYELPKPKETRNYVVFDDKLIDILKKYGLAGLAALPAAGAYHFQDKDIPKRARGGSIKFKPDWWIKAKARRAAFA